MAALRVRPPDVLTRVSEYMPEIVAYVARILANGFAYTAPAPGAAAGGAGAGATGGAPSSPPSCDVYFDTGAYRAAGFVYGRLNPWSVAPPVGGGGGGGDGNAPPAPTPPPPSSTMKRSPADFAMLKAAKQG